MSHPNHAGPLRLDAEPQMRMRLFEVQAGGEIEGEEMSSPALDETLRRGRPSPSRVTMTTESTGSN